MIHGTLHSHLKHKGQMLTVVERLQLVGRAILYSNRNANPLQVHDIGSGLEYRTFSSMHYQLF